MDGTGEAKGSREGKVGDGSRRIRETRISRSKKVEKGM